MSVVGPHRSAARERDVLVTGEAVILDLRPASFAARLLSFLIDGTLQLVIQVGGILALMLLQDVTGFDDAFGAAGLIVVTAAALVGYPVLAEQLLRGRSLGRLALGTRVVRDDGGPVHVRQSLLRALIAILEIWSSSGAIALVCSLVDPRGRRLGDLLAGTFVIQERLRAPRPVRGAMPPDLEEWARTADIARLDRPLLQEIRAFLPRAASLHPPSRRSIARDLLERTVPSVAPPPPPGTDPERFLRAVLAERSRRDEELLREGLAREEQLTAQVRAMPFAPAGPGRGAAS